jgi:hypothetical protein
MPQIFHRSTNTFSRVSIFGAVFMAAGALGVLGLFVRSSYWTNVGVAIEQPVPFSHKHHVSDDGIDCRYCHTSVETSSFAGMPPTQTCMNCHSQIWTTAPVLQPVRESWANGTPIAWNRVYDLPDFVYFNHSAHVDKGIGCVTCHGRIDQQQVTAKATSLQMEWCINCHMKPEDYVRPKAAVFSMDWQPGEAQSSLGPRLVQEYQIERKISCSTCHR